MRRMSGREEREELKSDKESYMGSSVVLSVSHRVKAIVLMKAKLKA